MGKTFAQGVTAMNFEYRQADLASLEKIWQHNIDRNPGDERWVRWKDEYIQMNVDGALRTFLVLCDGEPVGEGTLIFSPQSMAVVGRPMLCDGSAVTNLNALRIEKRFEGQGHISRMVKLMEDHARDLGYKTITIGVEAKEARNRAIYDHWGYRTLILTEEEDGETVLYYSKPL